MYAVSISLQGHGGRGQQYRPPGPRGGRPPATTARHNARQEGSRLGTNRGARVSQEIKYFSFIQWIKIKYGQNRPKKDTYQATNFFILCQLPIFT